MKFARAVIGRLGLLPVLVLALSAATPVPGTEAAARVVDADHFDHELLAHEIFLATNAVRIAEGVVPLKPEPLLVTAANEQAAMLSIRIHGGHDNPLANQADPFARVMQAGLHEGTVAENAATLSTRNPATGRNYTYRELAAVVVQAWMDSPGHRANLLNPALHFLGCGTRVAYLMPGQSMLYAIQDFYTPAPRVELPPPAVHPRTTGRTP